MITLNKKYISSLEPKVAIIIPFRDYNTIIIKYSYKNYLVRLKPCF